MGLLNLPAEIIDYILDLSLPLGIEGLALTCKALHGRAAPQIRRHNALKQKWKRTCGYSTFRILDDISQDPLAAEYIQVLDLWEQEWDPQEDIKPDFEVDEDRLRMDPEALAHVKAMVAKTEFLKQAKIDLDDWWEAIRVEREWWCEDALGAHGTIISLLGLLPNLKCLRLSPGWANFDYIEPQEATNGILIAGLRALVGLSRAACEGPLTKLKAMLPFMHEGYYEKAGLQCVEPFLALDTLTELYLVSAVAVDDGYSGIPFRWWSQDFQSALTRVELVASCMDGDGISALVAHTPNLSVFRYSHQTKHHGCEHDWNPGSFVEALARHCGNTITELAITIDEVFGDIINGASSFLALPRLEKMEVDVQVFCGPPIESGQSLGQNAILPDGMRPWTKDDIPCIGSMLSDHIKEMHINTDFPDPDHLALKALLKNLRDQRATRLHQLERVYIREYNGDSAEQYAIDAGATLQSFDLGAETVRPRHLMPDWKREFYARVGDLGV